VVLPGSPLKSLKSYVFKGKDRCLLIDTGFNRPECLASLKQGIAELNLDMNKTDILITHCHSDHSGLVSKIAAENSRIFMNALDHRITIDFIENGDHYWREIADFNIHEGFPAEEMERSLQMNPARNFAAEQSFAAIPVADNDVLRVGEAELRAIATPGHTPGHMCFYLEKEKIMLAGDHVLFDITPNITAWKIMPDSLEHYLRSLRKVRSYEVKTPLAAHRESNGSWQGRIDELLLHHEQRLQNAYDIVAQAGSLHAYDVASRMRWDIRARDWSDFPLGQKRFAVGEAIAHLNYLVEDGRLRREEVDGINYYSTV
jgi:glyoxylase-like metal-dependent hydrolase (beta-lactamase superfamily II)